MGLRVITQNTGASGLADGEGVRFFRVPQWHEVPMCVQLNQAVVN